MDIDEEELKKRHEGSLTKLWEIYQADGKYYENKWFKISSSVVAVFVICSQFLTISTYEVLKKVIDISIGILPNLLGFNLGAYILIVGFGGTEILATITKPLPGVKNFSLYQKLNGVFGVSVLFQIFTLIIVFLLILWDKIQGAFVWQPQSEIAFFCIRLVNISALFFVSLLAVYSIMLLVTVTKHVFLFAQTIHLTIYVNEIVKGRQKDEKSKSSSIEDSDDSSNGNI